MLQPSKQAPIIIQLPIEIMIAILHNYKLLQLLDYNNLIITYYYYYNYYYYIIMIKVTEICLYTTITPCYYYYILHCYYYHDNDQNCYIEDYINIIRQTDEL